ncbi:hypothetical protein SPIRO4BDMA_40235 [uncultured spirochete]|uniref:Uncharacterized protein n=1 Tax=uncultured spirochete TaxID=156406 RepID=A0A3P3XN03_9SPIR|nr:hypothetical protein SPIRO4BDMA_40235 [uncultured spirochete]
MSSSSLYLSRASPFHFSIVPAVWSDPSIASSIRWLLSLIFSLRLLTQGALGCRTPQSELSFNFFSRVRSWQEIALALLKKYTEHFYIYQNHLWELPHLEIRYLEPDDLNFLGVGEASDDSY